MAGAVEVPLSLVGGHINACGILRSPKIYKLAALGKRAL